MGNKNLLKMSRLLEMIHVKKGQELHLNQKNKKVVYFVKTGMIKIVNKEKGHTISVLNMGNIFGELSIYHDEQGDEHGEKAIVLENGVVCLIATEQMKMLIERHKNLKNELIKLQGLKIRRLQRNLEDLLYKNSETRIKEYILNYVHKYGQPKEGVMIAKNLLSHKDIAQLTSTSRQTVSNTLSKLRREVLIDYNSNEIFIL